MKIMYFDDYKLGVVKGDNVVDCSDIVNEILEYYVAHGALATMELPLVAGTTGMFWFFWRFLESNRWRWFWARQRLSWVVLFQRSH